MICLVTMEQFNHIINPLNFKKMRRIKILPIVVITVLLFTSCAKIFYSPDAYNLARNQNTFAILPHLFQLQQIKKLMLNQ